MTGLALDFGYEFSAAWTDEPVPPRTAGPEPLGLFAADPLPALRPERLEDDAERWDGLS